jgi:hypothetical protein
MSKLLGIEEPRTLE